MNCRVLTKYRATLGKPTSILSHLTRKDQNRRLNVYVLAASRAWRMPKPGISWLVFTADLVRLEWWLKNLIEKCLYFTCNRYVLRWLLFPLFDNHCRQMKPNYDLLIILEKSVCLIRWNHVFFGLYYYVTDLHRLIKVSFSE